MTDALWTESLDIVDSFAQVFYSELMPVHADAQGVIGTKLQKRLDLDKWIGEEWPDSSDEDDSDDLKPYDDDWFASSSKFKS